MNKKIIVASLNNIANELDSKGLYNAANSITKIMVKIAQEDPGQEDPGQEDPGQDEPLKPENPEIAKELERLQGERRDKITTLFKKTRSTNDLNDLYILKEELLNSSGEPYKIQNLIKDVNDRIAYLEKETLEKYQYMISKPYFETNLVNFQKVGKDIENDPNFKSLHEKTKQKIREYYLNLSEKIKTRQQERPNQPLQNMDAMKGKPDAIVNFITKNLQYETNKILSPKTFNPILQEYMQNFIQFDDLSGAERQRTLQFVMDKYKVEKNEAVNLARQLENPQNAGVRNLVRKKEIEHIHTEMGQIFKDMKSLASEIFNNAKKFAASGNAAEITPLPEFPVRAFNFAPNRTLNNLLYSMFQNYYDLSKSLPAAQNLKNFVDALFQKVNTAISIVDFDNLNDQFDVPKPLDLPDTPEEMEENQRLYKPLYPGSRPPE